MQPSTRSRRARLGILLALPLVVLAFLIHSPSSNGQTAFNYGAALERAIWFFDANKCGANVAVDNVFSWRSACHTSDGSAASPARDLSGGFHDAGDHVKFGLPQGFAAGVLGWSLYEYRAEFDEAGVTAKTLSTLKYFTDYFLKSHPNATTFYYQVGEGNADHGYWGSPELQTGSRPVFVANATSPASDILGQHAAALALMSINYRSTDAAYADRCLTAARELFDMGRTNLGRGTDGGGGAFYRSTSHFDDLAWAAIWLNIATGDAAYLAPVDGWISQPNDTSDNPYQKRWTMAWDDMTVANLLKMYQLTGQIKYFNGLTNNLEWYRDTLQKTPSGLPWLNQWGVLRYASAEAGIGYLAYKKFGYAGFFERGNFIVNYALGSNPRNGSFVTNYLTNPPVHPHHRANEPVQGGPTHGLIGALVGGPGSNDDYVDSVGDFQRNEVALDYNASFVFALSGRLYFANGGQPGTPPSPPPPPPMSPPSNGAGLTGNYYLGTALAGTPVLTRVDPTINFNFAGGSPAANIPADGFSIRWEGQVEARSNEAYTFCVTHDDGARLFVNNVLVVDNWTDHAAIEDCGTINLALGTRYPIRMEFYESSGDASASLAWSTPLGLAKQIIPTTQLFPIGPLPSDFSLAATPATISLARGTAATSTIAITRSGGFTGDVALSASGLPAGVTASFSPTPTAGNSSVLTLTASGTAAPGPATVTVTATSGTLTHSTSISLTVTAPDFSLAASPASLTINRGASGTSAVAITRLNGFAGSVAFTASGLPAGVTASFNPTSTTANSSVLTLTASSTATTGPATVTVTGTSGALVHTATIALTVNAPATPDFSLAASPVSVTVVRGASGTSTIAITRTGGFTGGVSFAASGLPTGVTAAFNPTTPATGASSVVTLSASATATTGPATVTITGTSGALVHTASISLTVNAAPVADFSLAASPATLAITQGASGTSTMAITRINAFTGGVTFTTSGLPAGVTAGFSLSPATGNSSVLTLTAAATATTGLGTVTITGTSGTLVHTTSIGLTVNASTGGGTGGVTLTPVVSANGPWFNEEQLQLANTAPVTALAITLTIQRSGGISNSNQYNTVGGQIAQSNSSTTTAITYQFTLAAGQSLGAGSGRIFAAQSSGTGTVHPTAGDLYSVTYTTGGVAYTQSGHF
jgi:endoglucanase